MNRDQVKFYLEGQGQVALMSNAHGVFQLTNPRKYVNMISLSLISPPYRAHTTWVSQTEEPQLTRVGTFSIRGIRTPRLEARLGLHGKVLYELKEKAIFIPPNAMMKPDHSSHSGGQKAAIAAQEPGQGDGINAQQGHNHLIETDNGQVFILGEQVGSRHLIKSLAFLLQSRPLLHPIKTLLV